MKPSASERWRTRLGHLKPWLETIQAIVTVGAIVIGGLWTYRLFVVDRQDHAHAKLSERVTHVALAPNLNLIQVVLSIENTGHTLLSISKARVFIQQVSPLNGCATSSRCTIDQLNAAVRDTERTDDRFDWTLVARRDTAMQRARPIEPGESEDIDVEFAIPSSVQTARIYGFVRNNEISTTDDFGWHVVQLYSFENKETQP
jgi:hypothetical protein